MKPYMPSWLVVPMVLLLLLEAAFPQTPSDQGLDSEIESVRADIRADRTAIITDAMNFTSQEASVFWPIYHQYESDLAKVNEERVQLTKAYAEKFIALNDEDARLLAVKAIDLASRRVELKKKYFKKFSQRMEPIVVLTFFQLEHRLDLIIDLKVASELPAILVKTSRTSGQ